MKIKHWLWLLWFSLIASMLLKWRADTYVLVVLIVLPILIEILDVREELAGVQEELRSQRRVMTERNRFLQDKLNDLTQWQQKQMVADFTEMARAEGTAATTTGGRLPASGVDEARSLRLAQRKRRKERRERRARALARRGVEMGVGAAVVADDALRSPPPVVPPPVESPPPAPESDQT